MPSHAPLRGRHWARLTATEIGRCFASGHWDGWYRAALPIGASWSDRHRPELLRLPQLPRRPVTASMSDNSEILISTAARRMTRTAYQRTFLRRARMFSSMTVSRAAGCDGRHGGIIRVWCAVVDLYQRRAGRRGAFYQVRSGARRDTPPASAFGTRETRWGTT